jgi:O-antigen/teichoic acid export membrane protein
MGGTSNRQPANQLARGSVIGSIALAAGYLVQYLFQLSISRTLEAEAAGTLFVAIAFVLLLSVITRLGLDKTGLKAVSVSFTDKHLGTIREITLLLVLLTGLASVLVCSFIIFAGSRLTALIALPADNLPVTIIYCAIPLVSLALIFSEVLRGMRLIGRSSLVQLLVPYGTALLIIWGAWHHTGGTPLAGALAFFSGFAASVLLGAGFILKATTACSEPVFSRYKDVTRGAPSMLWSSLVLFAMSSGDVIILACFVPGDEVAYYFAASRTAMLISVGLVGINSIVVPMIASAHKEQDPQHLGEVARMGARLSGSVATFLVGFLLLAGEWVLSLFGSEYEGSFLLLLILLTGQLVNSAVGAVAYIMFMSGQERNAARILTLVIAIMLLLYVAVIPVLGITGAALVTAFGVAIWNLGMMRSIYRTLGVLTLANNLSRCALFLAGVAAAAYAADMAGVTPLYPALLYTLLTPFVMWKYVLLDEDRDALTSVVG